MRRFALKFTRDDHDDRGLIVISNRDVTGKTRAEALLAGEKQLLEMVAQGHSLSVVLTALCQLFEKPYGDSLTSILLLDSTKTPEEKGKMGSFA